MWDVSINNEEAGRPTDVEQVPFSLRYIVRSPIFMHASALLVSGSRVTYYQRLVFTACCAITVDVAGNFSLSYGTN